MRPDLYILGEVSGVGPGTERFYADNSTPGGVESAYDWSLKNFIIDPTFWTQSSSSRVANLDQKLRNGSSNSGMGFLPGPNSYYMRFLENHDEDRVIYLFSSGVDTTTAMLRTMPVSTSVLLAVGMPMVYSGEEVGWGLGISNYDQRRRGVINWNTSRTSTLMPHYQKLAQIRKQFASFTTQKMVRVIASSGGVYAYTRPDSGLNGIVVANLDGVPFSGTVTLTTHSTPPSVEGVVDGVQYTATDLYNGNATSSVIFNAGVANLSVNLPAFRSAVFVLADSPKTLILPPLVGVIDGQTQTLPAKVALEQNYPNPFNPVTIIRYAIPRQSNVTLKVFDVLGREVATLVNQRQNPGVYSATWDASLAASGIYFYKLSTEHSTLVRKMVLLK